MCLYVHCASAALFRDINTDACNVLHRDDAVDMFLFATLEYDTFARDVSKATLLFGDYVYARKPNDAPGYMDTQVGRCPPSIYSVFHVHFLACLSPPTPPPVRLVDHCQGGTPP